MGDMALRLTLVDFLDQDEDDKSCDAARHETYADRPSVVVLQTNVADDNRWFPGAVVPTDRTG